LDTACVLALLQEELVDPVRHREVCRLEPFNFAKSAGRAPLPHVPPPQWAEHDDKPTVMAPDRRGHGVEEKLSTLHDYCCAHGLCIRCVEKWSRDHKCPEAIQLHVPQKLWEVCHAEDCLEPECEEETEEISAQLCMAISMAASSGTVSLHAIQFKGTVQGHAARILVDSGSSHTFFRDSLVAKLTGVSSFSPPLLVTVADGSVMQCSAQFLELEWSVQDYQFCSTAKVLPLNLS
jgi:hypothetical protein